MKLAVNRCPFCGCQDTLGDRKTCWVCSHCEAELFPPERKWNPNVVLDCMRHDVPSKTIQMHVGSQLKSGSKSKNYTDSSIKMKRPTVKKIYEQLSSENGKSPLI